MSRRDITNALKARLTSISLPKAWPNQDFTVPAVPADAAGRAAWGYLSVSILRAGTSDDTLDCEAPIQTGRFILTVVALSGTSDGTADDHADAVAALFPMGLRLPAGEQTITIMQPPHIREGMPDDGYWRVPVSIPYQAE